MMIGKYRLIKAGTVIFSTALQENIKFEKDVIVKVTNHIFGSNDCVFGELQMLLFNMVGFIPGLVPKANGTVTFNISDTIKYKIPEPKFIEFTYGKETNKK